MKAFDAYLFDLDGTLIDSIELILASFRHTMRVHRGTAPEDDAWLRGIGTPLRTQFRAFSDDENEIAAMVETYRAHNLANHDRMVRAFPGIDSVVRTLAVRAPLGIVTSKLRGGAMRGLARCGLDGLFQVVVAADDVTRHKPHPEPVERAVTLLEVDPARTVFVGDSPHDLAAGRGAGVRTAAASWGPFPRAMLEPHTPDYWCGSPDDLLTLATPSTSERGR